MTETAFPALQPTGDPHRWTLTITEDLCTGAAGRQHLFGGSGLAVAMMAMERTTGLPTLWATVQFLSFAPIGSTLELDVRVAGGGRNVRQTIVRGTVDGREVIAASGALGGGSDMRSEQWECAPQVPPPDAGRVVVAHHNAHRDIHAALDIRAVDGRFGIFSKDPVSGTGHVRVWMRSLRRPVDTIALAIMGDFVPSVASNALNLRAGGNSLDNTIRIRRIVPTEWVLCDIALEGVHGGFGHGRITLFAEDGTLMAVASQSFKLSVLLPRPKPESA